MEIPCSIFLITARSILVKREDFAPYNTAQIPAPQAQNLCFALSFLAHFKFVYSCYLWGNTY